MRVLDPNNPFPFWEENSYAEEKEYSAAADAWLGLRISEIEAALPPPREFEQNWASKGADIFLTPYTELRRIAESLSLKAGDTVVDLGAGYGRLGFVLERHFPGVTFVGYELVPERVREGNRVLNAHGCKNAELLTADLTKIIPVAAPFYFLYDYGTRGAIEKTLGDLRGISAKQGITLVGRGRAVRDAVEKRHPWLGEVVAPEHHAHYSIYRSS